MKTWWKSRTVWTGIVAIVVGAVASIAKLITGTELLGLEAQESIALVIVGAIVLVLRFVTKEPIV